MWLLRVVCGVTAEFRGVEKIPPGALLVASKHQSLWETFALFALFADPAYIMKRELMWIPFFGWYAWKARMIPVDRGKRSQALADMTVCARQELDCGRQILIFPEGERHNEGEMGRFRPGVGMIASRLGLPVVPVRIDGLDKVLHPKMRWPQRGAVRIAFGAPLTLTGDDYPGLAARVEEAVRGL